HPHRHSPGPEMHSHSPEQPRLAVLDRSLGTIGGYQLLRPLVVGIVHGLAGSAAVALLILATIRNSSWAIAYLLVFGLGTIAGMMLITMSIASTFRLVGHRFHRFSHRLAAASGLVSLAFGLFLAYRIAVVQGLFSMHPHWTPHQIQDSAFCVKQKEKQLHEPVADGGSPIERQGAVARAS